jgi:signal transduction histidine kinase
MSQSVDHLLRRLTSDAPTERLEAARYFAAHATREHEPQLREALGRENVHWIRVALKRALARMSAASEVTPAVLSLDSEDIPARLATQVYADALEEAASQLIHEVEPLLGALRLAAEREVNEFEKSNTRKHLDRLDELLDALSRLRRAASAPKIDEFSLDEVVQQSIQELTLPDNVVIQKAGPQPCVVEGDSTLVALSLGNGLRNAVEATYAAGGDLQKLPIIITWGHTDLDCWVSIVDVGIGFKGNLQRAFDMGTTTKAGHLGMGLATAKQAMESMSGRLLLIPNPRGVRFEMRWPLQKSAQ